MFVNKLMNVTFSLAIVFRKIDYFPLFFKEYTLININKDEN